MKKTSNNALADDNGLHDSCMLKTLKKKLEDMVKEKTDVFKVISAYDEFLEEYSCKPDREKFPHYVKNEVIDEDKSVKWNREEVERRNLAFDEEVKRLNRQKNTISQVYEEVIVKVLSKESKVTTSEGKVIWQHARNQGGDAYEAALRFIDYGKLLSKLGELRKVRTKETREKICQKHNGELKEAGDKSSFQEEEGMER